MCWIASRVIFSNTAATSKCKIQTESAKLMFSELLALPMGELAKIYDF